MVLCPTSVYRGNTLEGGSNAWLEVGSPLHADLMVVLCQFKFSNQFTANTSNFLVKCM